MKVKKIVLIFENCDEVTLLVKDIDNIILHGISKEISINPYQYMKGEMLISYIVEQFYLSVRRLDNKRQLRIRSHPDITQIHIYTDKTHYCYYLLWNGSGMINNYQKVKTFKTGGTEISINFPCNG